jgi:hypothetical protein
VTTEPISKTQGTLQIHPAPHLGLAQSAFGKRLWGHVHLKRVVLNLHGCEADPADTKTVTYTDVFQREVALDVHLYPATRAPDRFDRAKSLYNACKHGCVVSFRKWLKVSKIDFLRSHQS